ncbi:MAG: DUF4249 domain-containing protein [Bacteroidales bacterium]|nr:DUF4249 domain-containing protein [Bacteroidales bacterium]
MRNKILYTLLTSAIFTACVEDFDIVMDNNNDYVCIDAIITNADTIQGVYIRKTAKVDGNAKNTTHEFISTARITLTDNSTGQEYLYNSPGKEYKRGDTTGREDIPGIYWEDYRETIFGKDAYVLTGFKPEPGRSYTMNIEVNGKRYTSTQYLHKDPLVEGITFRPYKASESGLVSDEYDAYNPTLHIGDSEPDMDNYYIFIGNVYAWDRELTRTGNTSYQIPITPISEQDFKPGINAIDVNETMGIEAHSKGSGIEYGQGYTYSLWSVSKENYKYLCAIKDHMTTDGGVYTPYLDTPPTNFSGEHVMGQFMAINETHYKGVVTYRNID